MSEKVSVLLALPVGTAEDAAVQETLRGIAAQTYPSSLIEVIQVHYAPNEPGAHTSALNAARDGATGAFVVQVKSGVVWDGNKIEKQVVRLLANPSAGGNVHRMTGRRASGKTWVFDLKEVRTYGLRIGSLLRSPWGPGAALLKWEAMAQAGAYRNIEEALWEYAVRLIGRGHLLDFLEEDLAVWNIDAASHTAPVDELRRLAPVGIRHPFLKSCLDRIAPESLIAGGKAALECGGRLVLAGLHQRNDDFEASHAMCREAAREGDCAGADYWHGIVHRREPDFASARRWFQKVGDFGAMPAIYRDAVALLQRVLQMPDYGEAREMALCFLRHLQARGTWDPLYFTDLCEACAKEGTPEGRRLLAEVQEAEFAAMFDWTYRMATGA